MIDSSILMIHAAATIAMTGIIWTMQLVHYPLFALASRQRFAEFAGSHGRATGRLVIPVMLLEPGAAALLLLRPQTAFPLAAGIAGLALLLVIRVSTFTGQVPCHRALADRFDADAHGRLVRTNWVRTIAWTGRTGIVLWGMIR